MYGDYFTMGGSDPYRIELSITRSDGGSPVKVDFTYCHGTSDGPEKAEFGLMSL